MKKICLFTATRAEYGLLKRLIKLLNDDQNIDFQLLVSGTHLSPKHGYTLNEINSDGFHPTSLIDIPLNEGLGMAEITGRAMSLYSDYLKDLKPEILILLGDRFETFAAASCAHLMRIPIAHIHGGETTEGAIDDALRHSITLFSKWHFTSAKQHLEKVIMLGANKKNSYCIGPMVLDSINNIPEMKVSVFEKETGFKFTDKNLLMTYHSETLCKDYGIKLLKDLLKAISKLIQKNKEKVNLLITYPNVDSYSNEIISILSSFQSNFSDNIWLMPSLGHNKYISALKLFDGVIGNSSSGIIEAPLIGVPVVNIGNRQKGRFRFGDVIDIEDNTDDIYKAIKSILDLPKKDSNLISNDYHSPSKIIYNTLISSKN